MILLPQINIENPQKLALDAEQAFGSYKTWAANTSIAILDQKAFTGARTADELPFGQWLVGLNVANGEVEKAKEQLLKELEAVFSSVSNLMDFLEIEEFDLAKDVYVAEVLPSVESIQVYVDNMMQQVRDAMDLYGQLEQHEREATSVSLAKTEKILDEIVAKTNYSVEMYLEEGIKAAGTVTTVLIAAVALGTVLALGIGILLAQSIFNVIGGEPQIMADIAQNIAEGNLKTTFDSTDKKAVGLYASMREMSENLRQVMGDISGNSLEVATASEKLSSTSQQMASSAEEMNSQSSTVAAAAEQINANMNVVLTTADAMSQKSTEIATSSENMSANVNSVAAAIEEMTASISEVAENTGKGAQLAGKAREISASSSDKMKELESSAADVGNVVTIITEITEQIKLLALNATIEAARAGDAGKGFAVVANEVKDLAKQTADATDSIVAQVKEMQEQTVSVAGYIREGAEVNQEVEEVTSSISAAVEEQSATINEISRTVAETSQGVSQVSDTIKEFSINIEQEIVISVKEAVAGTNDVSQNINGVNSASQDVAQGARSINDASDQLANLSSQLQKQVGKFQI